MALAALCYGLDCGFFAYSHHLDFDKRPNLGLRLHNYPEGYETWFDRRRLGLVDPVHRASEMTHWRFLWSELSELIIMTPSDRQVFAHARSNGIGEGITVPYCVRGQMHGSFSLANRAGQPIDHRLLDPVQYAGDNLFECVKRLMPHRTRMAVQLTDRQRDCLVWLMRGKTFQETGIILGIAGDTVKKHLRDVRARFGDPVRGLLFAHVINDGALSLDDILMDFALTGKSPL